MKKYFVSLNWYNPNTFRYTGFVRANNERQAVVKFADKFESFGITNFKESPDILVKRIK